MDDDVGNDGPGCVEPHVGAETQGEGEDSNGSQIQDPPDEHQHGFGNRLEEPHQSIPVVFGDPCGCQGEQECEDNEGEHGPVGHGLHGIGGDQAHQPFSQGLDLALRFTRSGQALPEAPGSFLIHREPAHQGWRHNSCQNSREGDEGEEELDFSLDEESADEAAAELDLAEDDDSAEVDFSEDETVEEEAPEIDLGGEEAEAEADLDFGAEEEEESAIGISDLAPSDEVEEEVTEEEMVEEEGATEEADAAASQGLGELDVEGLDLDSAPTTDPDKVTPSVKTGTALDDFDVDLGDLMSSKD
jgi:hypothetical protein